MLVIFYVDVIFCQNFNFPHIYHIVVEKAFLEMQTSHMVHIMFNDMLLYIFNFHKFLKSFKLFLEYICVF
jgi:hypothetical protein